MCPAGGERGLTEGEIGLAREVFGNAIAYDRVRIRRRKFFPFQPRNVTMAPCGHIHFHPMDETSYCADFAQADIRLQGHFIHEMTHVWQAQTRGRFWLLYRRMPWTRYDYALRPGWPLTRYNPEQQAEIVRHAFLLRRGEKLSGVSDAAAYDLLVRF